MNTAFRPATRKDAAKLVRDTPQPAPQDGANPPRRTLRRAKAAAKAGPANKPDPKQTAQEAVHQVMPKEAAKKLLPPPLTDEPVTDTAAHGDDDLMSKKA